MQKIKSATELKNAIQRLEVEQTIQGQLLSEQFNIVYESLKPVNIIKQAMKDLVTSPSLISNVLGVTVGLSSGYLAKKLVVGQSGSIIKNIVGSLLQNGVANVVATHAISFTTLTGLIVKLFSRKKVAANIKK
jgi:hypothetical protein